MKQGWKPKRTIIYCAWDGEEPGLLGSTEWAETHADELQQARRGLHQLRWQRPRLSGAGRLARRSRTSSTASRATSRIPRRTHRLEARHICATSHTRTTPRNAARSASAPICAWPALGSGSDYTAFHDHLGIASLESRLRRRGRGRTQYHSIYDDFYWYTHFADTDFAYGRALAQTARHGGDAHCRRRSASLRLHAPQAEAIAKYETELEKLARRTSRTNSPSAISNSRRASSARPPIRTKPTLPPPAEDRAAIYELRADEEFHRTAEEERG